ncbi:major facilitator superfamily domain-containing protein [Rhypophila decipiens]|uniref:Major facilitator superfamily domain-containing protein n=1 Tax=Rhypophila decipiens TaxID=261697 RepID=A0AAN6XWQ5_9PEZI|nr:major facilitator superfamily domain-containing protein [Rhypophila decipiens]
MASHDNAHDVRQPLLASGGADHVSYDGSERTSSSSSPASSITAVNSPKEVTVEFDPNGDPENPQDWPLAFKWGIVLMLSMMGFITTFTCISMVPLASTIVDDLSRPSSASSFFSTLNVDTPMGITRAAASNVLLVTIWELGEAAGPLLIAPLSELHGRYIVMNVANTLLILSTVMAALSTSVPMFILARALTGLSVTANVLNPAIIGDIFPAEQRGSAVSMVFLAPLVGGAIGPGIATTIAAWCGSWRAVVWVCIVVAGVCEIFFLLGFKETYSVVILRKRVERVRKERELFGKDVGGEEEEPCTPVKLVLDHDAEGAVIEDGLPDAKHGALVEMKKLRDAVLRPAHVLGGSAVLMALSTLGSVLFSYYYVISVTMPSVLTERYGLSTVQTGWCFISFTFGSFVSVIFCEGSLDKIYIRLRDAHRTKTNDPTAAGKPEYRLPMSTLGAFLCPVAIGVYGWTAELGGPLPILLLSVAATGAGVILTIVPMMAYIVDAFGLYSASAITGVIVTRCLMSTFLPLATGPLIDNYGYGWGFMAFSVLSLVLAPISIVVLRYGEAWRRWSKYTRENM